MKKQRKKIIFTAEFLTFFMRIISTNESFLFFYGLINKVSQSIHSLRSNSLKAEV